MELNQLRYFVKLSEVQNFSKAAEELYITQPTLSQQIKRLENELGVELFIRSTRSVRLTESGQLCYEHAKAVLDGLNRLIATAEEIQRRKEGHIAVGILAVLPHWDISAALEEFKKEYPQIHITMEFDWSKNLVERLLQKELDVVISKVFWNENDPHFDKLNVKPFGEGELQVIVGKRHPLAQQNAVRLDQIVNERVLMADQHACVVHYINQLIEEKGLQPPQYSVVRSNTSLFKMIEANMGISVMSNDIIQEFSRNGVCLLPLSPPTQLKTGIVTRKDLKSDSISRIFENFILNFVNQSDGFEQS